MASHNPKKRPARPRPRPISKKKYKDFKQFQRKLQQERQLEKESLLGLGLFKKRLKVERAVSQRGRRHWAAGKAPGQPQQPQTAVMDSTVIASFSYRLSKQKLTIQFQSGHVYEYYDVPEQEVRNLANAPSKGRYFYYNIRTAYEYTRIK
jgi:hypothetical protein